MFLQPMRPAVAAALRGLQRLWRVRPGQVAQAAHLQPARLRLKPCAAVRIDPGSNLPAAASSIQPVHSTSPQHLFCFWRQRVITGAHYRYRFQNTAAFDDTRALILAKCIECTTQRCVSRWRALWAVLVPALPYWLGCYCWSELAASASLRRRLRRVWCVSSTISSQVSAGARTGRATPSTSTPDATSVVTVLRPATVPPRPWSKW